MRRCAYHGQLCVCPGEGAQYVGFSAWLDGERRGFINRVKSEEMQERGECVLLGIS